MEDIQSRIDLLCRLPLEDALKDARISTFSIIELQNMAGHLNMAKGRKRNDLVLAIRTKMEKTRTLRTILANNENKDSEDVDSEEENQVVFNNQNMPISTVSAQVGESDDDEEDDDEEEEDDGDDGGAAALTTTYRKDKNTMPRLINILMQNPDAVARSHLLATRVQLQNGEVYDKQRIFRESMIQFNDRAFNSGGLVANHKVFTDRAINPEVIGNGIYKSKKAWMHFKAVRKAYAKSLKNFQASGHHANHDFFNYCKNDADVLYLYLMLEKTNNPEISAFMQEGAEINGGLDTSMGLNSSRDSQKSTNSQSSRRSSTNNESDNLLKELVTSQKRRHELDVQEMDVTKQTFRLVQHESLTKSLSALSTQIGQLESEIDDMESIALLSENQMSKLSFKKKRLEDFRLNYEFSNNKVKEFYI